MGVSKPLSLWGRGMEAGLFCKLYDFSNILSGVFGIFLIQHFRRL
jgi:hypothetical protein